jgi:hypothetical protein
MMLMRGLSRSSPPGPVDVAVVGGRARRRGFVLRGLRLDGLVSSSPLRLLVRLGFRLRPTGFAFADRRRLRPAASAFVRPASAFVRPASAFSSDLAAFVRQLPPSSDLASAFVRLGFRLLSDQLPALSSSFCPCRQPWCRESRGTSQVSAMRARGYTGPSGYAGARGRDTRRTHRQTERREQTRVDPLKWKVEVRHHHPVCPRSASGIRAAPASSGALRRTRQEDEKGNTSAR